MVSFFKWQIAYNKQSSKDVLLSALQVKFPQGYGRILWFFGKRVPGHAIAPLKSLNDVCVHYITNDLQTLLRYEDRNSMRFSRESRLPFLDYRLVEFILSLSISQRFRGNQTKWILRKAMQGINLETILKRRDKIGFAAPENDWWARIQGREELGVHESMRHFIFHRWVENEKFV